MAARPSIDVSGWLQEQLAQASPDLLRSMVQTFAETLMSAEADAVCGADYGDVATKVKAASAAPRPASAAAQPRKARAEHARAVSQCAQVKLARTSRSSGAACSRFARFLLSSSQVAPPYGSVDLTSAAELAFSRASGSLLFRNRFAVCQGVVA